MWSDEEPDENLTDDWDMHVQDGGRLSVQNAQALDRLYDPKQAQSQFTGEALLDSQTKRLRPKQAMDYWATKKVEQMLWWPIPCRKPPTRRASRKLWKARWH